MLTVCSKVSCRKLALMRISRGGHNFVVAGEVRTALRENKPVVALESTIITHGMPYPQNVRCALEVEAVVRSNVS